MSRAAIYARVSTDEQAASGLGIAAQIDSARRWAAQHGYEVIGPFIDDGVSGATGLDKRPAMLDAIAQLEPKDVLLVAKRDRLGRDPLHVAMIEAACNRKKCRVISAAGEGTEGDDPTNILMRRIVDAFAEYERLVIGARTRAALRAKRARGERPTRTPFGFDLADDGRSLVVNLQEQEAIHLVQQWRAEGRPLRWIARELDHRGIRPKTGGDRWSHTSIVRILDRTTEAA